MEKYHTVAPDTDFCISGKPQTDDRDYMLRDVTRTQGMQEVKKGNLDVLVQIQSFDEIDTITDNFKVTMFFIKKEKKESYEQASILSVLYLPALTPGFTIRLWRRYLQ